MGSLLLLVVALIFEAEQLVAGVDEQVCLGPVSGWSYLPSRTSSLSISRMSSWMWAEIHTMPVFSIVVAEIILPLWLSSQLCIILHSFFVGG